MISARRDAAQRAFRRVVREADPSVVEGPGEGRPALQDARFELIEDPLRLPAGALPENIDLERWSFDFVRSLGCECLFLFAFESGCFAMVACQQRIKGRQYEQCEQRADGHAGDDDDADGEAAYRARAGRREERE
jgi:hypothetical protein